jgi:hypothetical protein
MAIGADDAGDDVADRHAIAHLRNRRVVVLAEYLERAVLELRGLRLFGYDRIRGVRGLPRQVLFARGITERAPDRHRPLAWSLDSAVGVEASFAGHFTRTLLVWIGSVHSLALGYCRLPTQACACFVKLKESLHYQKAWPECSARMSALEGNVLQNSSLRRESAIIESEPGGHGVLLVVVAPLPAFFAVEARARPDHPIIGS